MKDIKEKIYGIIWGAALIAVGVILGGNALGLFDINIFFNGWWTLFIIIPSLVGLITEKKKAGSLVCLLIGVLLLLAAQDVVSFDLIWKMIIPVIVVMIGVALLAKYICGCKIAEVHYYYENGKKNKKSKK